MGRVDWLRYGNSIWLRDGESGLAKVWELQWPLFKIIILNILNVQFGDLQYVKLSHLGKTWISQIIKIFFLKSLYLKRAKLSFGYIKWGVCNYSTVLYVRYSTVYILVTSGIFYFKMTSIFWHWHWQYFNASYHLDHITAYLNAKYTVHMILFSLLNSKTNFFY